MQRQTEQQSLLLRADKYEVRLSQSFGLIALAVISCTALESLLAGCLISGSITLPLTGHARSVDFKCPLTDMQAMCAHMLHSCALAIGISSWHARSMDASTCHLLWGQPGKLRIHSHVTHSHAH